MGGTPHMVTRLIGTVGLIFVFTIVTVVGGATLMAIRKPFAEEIGYQIDRLPERLFFIALRFFPEDERERRYNQWADDYQQLSDTYEKRALVRVYKCTRFSVSLATRSTLIRRSTGIRQDAARRKIILTLLGISMVTAISGTAYGSILGGDFGRKLVTECTFLAVLSTLLSAFAMFRTLPADTPTSPTTTDQRATATPSPPAT